MTSKLLGAAVRDGLLAKNPLASVDRPTAGRSNPAVLSADEVHALLRVAAGHRMFPLVQLLAATGLRRGELLGLQWDSLDLNTGRLHVRTSLGATDHGMKITEVKTPSSRRTVLLPPEVVNTLREHRISQVKMMGDAESWTDDNVVFSRRDGRPLSPDTATVHFQALCAKAGITRQVGFHSIRHQAATTMLDAGLNPKVVSEWMGHSSTRITLDIYSHVSEATQQLAADALRNHVIDASVRFADKRDESDRDLEAGTA